MQKGLLPCTTPIHMLQSISQLLPAVYGQATQIHKKLRILESETDFFFLTICYNLGQQIHFMREDSFEQHFLFLLISH